ncbi:MULTISPECIES: hypothetical protein [Glutamicibacter]|uniref:Uncharacterized protein n=1 Tax=Glutamicibacter ectropisis TaxID=3046593 RepID=A0AAU6WDY7_9MICC
MIAASVISLILALLFIGVFEWERQDRKKTGSKEDKFFGNWALVAFWICAFFFVVFALGALNE